MSSFDRQIGSRVYGYLADKSFKALLAFITGCVSLPAASVSFTGSATLGATSTPITYTEQVTYLGSNRPPQVSESSTPCNLDGFCGVASLTAAIPKVTLPNGSQVTSAELYFIYTPDVSISSPTLVSLQAIDPSQPVVAGTPGSHAGQEYMTFSSALGTSHEYLYGIDNEFLTYSEDYTAPVESSLADGGNLAPVSISEAISYVFKTAQSADPGFNDISTFQQTLGLQSASLDAYLVVNYTATAAPEPGVTCLTLAGLAMISYRLSRR